MKTCFIKRTYATFFGVALLATIALPEARAAASSAEDAGDQVQTGVVEQVAQAVAAAAEPVRIGPGRARFSFLPGGTWVGFGPSGRAGSHRMGREPLIGGGGFVVFETDGDSRVRQLVDTRRRNTRVIGGGAMRSHEGAAGGTRYPAARPDDDADGFIDEDRLDGIDNDNDGRVDEDFAAIGDAMVATTYSVATDATAMDAGFARPTLELHQESYAWTVPHIDGAVVTRLSVVNVSDAPITGLRLGAVFDKDERFSVDTQDFGQDDASPFTDPLVARGMLLRDGRRSVAALFFSPNVTADANNSDEASWLTGVAGGDRRLRDLVAASRHADAIRRPGEPEPQDHPDPHNDPFATPGTHNAPAKYVAYGISPDLGTLQPGDRVHIYVALVMPPSADRAARAIDNAYRTVIGDGTHRLIPPPVSVTRRVVWGTYELQSPGNAARGVIVRLANPRSGGVDPHEINYIRGMDLRSAMRAQTPDGNARLEFNKGRMDRFAGGGKVVLQGRMEGGEWFDAVLQPAVPIGDGHLLPAEQYFGEPGKLDAALLSGSPNPFRDATTIHFEVPAELTDEHGIHYGFAGAIATSVKVYDVTGRRVSTLIETTSTPGTYQTQWNAQDASGRSVASGVYYITLQIGKRHVTKRLIQLK